MSTEVTTTILAAPTTTTTTIPLEELLNLPNGCNHGWLRHNNQCYKVNTDKADFNTSRHWCQQQGADLVSINDADENDFVWRICGTMMDGKDDPIENPMNMIRDVCWLGLVEQPWTGDRHTPGPLQKWIWLDGTESTYRNWKDWVMEPLDTKNEPNNQPPEPSKPGSEPRPHDERHAVFNQDAGGMSGRWFDVPPVYNSALAVCEKAAVDRPHVPPKPALTGKAFGEYLEASWTLPHGVLPITHVLVGVIKVGDPAWQYLDASNDTLSYERSPASDKAVKAPTTSVVIKHVEKHAKYRIAVVMKNARGWSDWSPISDSFTVKDVTVPPAAAKPGLAGSGEGGCEELEASWTIPESLAPVTHILVGILKVGDAPSAWHFVDASKFNILSQDRLQTLSKAIKAPETSVVIHNLEDRASYRIAVVMRNAKGWGEWSPISDSFTVKKVALPPAATKPELAGFPDIGGRQLNVSWSIPSAWPPVTDVLVGVMEVPDVRPSGVPYLRPMSQTVKKIVKSVVVKAPKNSVVLYDLPVEMRYSVAVAMKNAKGWSYWSPISNPVTLKAFRQRVDKLIDQIPERQVPQTHVILPHYR